MKRFRWMVAAAAAALLVFGVYIALQDTGPRPRDESVAGPPVVFEGAVLVGRREGVPQWELHSHHMTSEDSQVLIDSLDRLLLLQQNGQPYQVTSSRGIWKADRGELVLPEETIVEGGNAWTAQSGALQWYRESGTTVLKDGVEIVQEDTVITAQKAEFDVDSGVLTMLGDVNISLREGSRSEN